MLESTDHRPWPVPSSPWVLSQSWHDVLFAHWTVPAEALRALLPDGLSLETFDGRAWLGVVPFRMSGVRLRGLPTLPGTGAFPELNVRTYVDAGDRPGVWFFSLDAASPLAVMVARRWFRLPYHRAAMSCRPAGDGRLDGRAVCPMVSYASRRTHAGSADAVLAGRYGPTGPVQPARPGSLEHFLTERYCLYTTGRDGRLRRAEIHHAPWPIQPAAAEFETLTMAEPLGLALDAHPDHLLFADRVDVVVWPPRRIDVGAAALE